ncbi:MAG: sugar nucleotide-binding protein [Fulvivirga sp.]
MDTKDYPTKAERPKYSVLDKRKIKTAINLEIPEWNVSLKTYLSNEN